LAWSPHDPHLRDAGSLQRDIKDEVDALTLVSLNRLCDLLICPICQSPLKPDGNQFACEAASGTRHSFPVIGTHPALVHFQESILDESRLMRMDGASEIARRIESRPRLRALQGWLQGPRRGPDPTIQVLAKLRAGSAPRRVLIIGGGTAGEDVRELYESTDFETVSFDIYRSTLTQFIADAHSIPLATGRFDAVFVQAVLEHVVDPWQVVREIHRVLRPGGIIFSSMPFMQQVHEGPYDFVRLTERGQRWLFRWFDEVESGVVAGPGVSLAWSIDQYVRSLTHSRLAGRIAHVAFGWLAWLEWAMRRGDILDGASCLYFVGTSTTEPLDVKRLRQGYRGGQREAARDEAEPRSSP
jgi:SAM-dependent methyltransferase